MALYTFSVPAGVTRPFESRPVFSIWTRISFQAGSTLVQNPDTSWTQYDVYSPQTQADPANKVFFGPQGFSGGVLGTVSSGTMGFPTPLRCYLGGHNYIINDALRTELLSAITSQQPAGYGAFIGTAPAGAHFTGDEILASGYTATNPAHSAPWGVTWSSKLINLPNWTGVAGSTWQELIGQP